MPSASADAVLTVLGDETTDPDAHLIASFGDRMARWPVLAYELAGESGRTLSLPWLSFNLALILWRVISGYPPSCLRGPSAVGTLRGGKAALIAATSDAILRPGDSGSMWGHR